MACAESYVRQAEDEQRSSRDQGMDSTEALEERRLKARVWLKQAMRVRRLPDLLAAIAEAEAVELYPVELEYARSIMEEERKAVCRISLNEARETRHVGDLQRSIAEAEAVGLAAEQTEIGKHVLAEEIEKRQSRANLLEALKKGTLEHLLAAVARGEAAGLSPLEMDRIKSALLVQQRKADAREGLRSSAEKHDVDKLKAAIREGQMAKLNPRELEAAKETLVREERKIAARHTLQDAEILRQGGDVETFRAAVKEGQLAGLDAEELQQHEEMVVKEDLKISARKNLEFARTGGKSGKVSKERMLEIAHAAVEEGERAELTNAELAEARELLIEAKKADARVVLHNAVLKRDLDAIRAAIEHGEKVGLNNLAFYEGNRVIADESAKLEVLQRIATALAGRRIPFMKSALKEGVNITLPECELAELRVALADEERKAAARVKLEEAVAAAIAREDSQQHLIAGLDAAIETGELAGLTEDEIDLARQKVLEIHQAIARQRIELAVKKRDIAEMREGIKVGEKFWLSETDLRLVKTTLAREEGRVKAVADLKDAIKCRDMDQCQAAIIQGEATVPGCREINDAKKVLKEEQRRTEARDGLLVAIHCRGIEVLKRWIGKAEAAGLHFQKAEDAGLPGVQAAQELANTRVVLAEEERKVAALAALEAAEASHSIPALRAAAREAEAAGVNPKDVEAANLCLAAELPKRARVGLETALADRRIKELRAAVNEGVTVGLDDSELKLARLALGEEQLAEALRRKTAFEIRRAIEDGERFFVDAASLENARRVLAAAEKKESARLQLRESEASKRIDEIVLAMSAGRAAGLQDWEFAFANKVVEEERRRMMAVNVRAR